MSNPSSDPIRKAGAGKLPAGPASATRSHAACNGDSEHTPRASDNRESAPQVDITLRCDSPLAAGQVNTNSLPHYNIEADALSSESDRESDSESDCDMALSPEKFDGTINPRDWLDDLTAYAEEERRCTDSSNGQVSIHWCRADLVQNTMQG